ncbi:dynamin family protein [Burkholderia sp. S171]|uniref:dynamin family protein n=1 Tax=Burkholderia sp. S171 TaxID=1641860 RepID=UPI00131CC9A9|nr:dynamin family protein [Burkholderia sp. S171]
MQCPHAGELREAIANTELLVPVIGSFSAGKSSLINTFIGREMLPVGIKPETELATELRYAEDERIEAVLLSGGTLRFDIAEMSSLKARANEFSHLRLWARCEALARIAPLVLVDMPGFDSTLANHNKAIANYIDKGAHYLVVVSVETGGVTRSMQRQLADIQELDRDFSLLLSKANVRAESEVDEVAAKIEEQAEDAFGTHRAVRKIGLDGAAKLQSALDAIDPEQLVESLFQGDVKRTHLEITEAINVALAGLETNATDNLHAVEEMKAGLVKVEHKREDLVADIEARYSSSAVRNCVDAVGHALEAGVPELVAAGMSGNRETLSRAVTEIVRGSLIRKIKAQMSEISQKIVAEFALELDDLNALMSVYTADADWVGRVTTNTTQLFEQANRGVSRLSEYMVKKNGTQTIYKVATTILAVTTNVVFPLLELVIIFLPDLLQPFFEARRRETIEANVRTEIIPGIKASLREKLPDIFREQVELLVRQVSGQFESAIAEKKEALEKLEQERRNHQESIQQRVAGLRDLQQRLNTLADEQLYGSEVVA